MRRDDFESGNADCWSPNGGSWSVLTEASADGGVNHFYECQGGLFESLVIGSSVSTTSVSVRMRVKSFGGTGADFGAGFIAQGGGSYGVMLSVNQAGQLRVNQGSLAEYARNAGTCQPTTLQVDARQWNYYLISFQHMSPPAEDINVQVYVNGGQSYGCTISGINGFTSSGPVGVFSYGTGTVADFDDMVW